MQRKIPDSFIEYVFRGRRKMLERMLLSKGIKQEGYLGVARRQEIYLGFTRHNPVVISCGPAGINGSVKGVGFVPKQRYLAELKDLVLEKVRERISQADAVRLLLEEIYVEERLDFSKLSSIELARKHTWVNLKANPRATLVFYTPPTVSYEVRVDVEIHESGDIWEYVNGLHDLYHRAARGRDWSKTPVYVFKIREIYDNSPAKMGERIF
ncbi:MAG: hypothetical protein DRN96_07670 [Thermoproteota archaeon]|nr:MAG: hypothetical protein DRN96_07670 [Candidatus Korarchaeota archaeon]RLG54726.1 MAG: hypothetical protein DRN99_04595 [Candidatus Korarchaeota archaeon]